MGAGDRANLLHKAGIQDTLKVLQGNWQVTLTLSGWHLKLARGWRAGRISSCCPTAQVGVTWFTFCTTNIRPDVAAKHTGHHSSLRPNSSSYFEFRLAVTVPLLMALYLRTVRLPTFLQAIILTFFFLINVLKGFKGLIGAFEARQEIMWKTQATN